MRYLALALLLCVPSCFGQSKGDAPEAKLFEPQHVSRQRIADKNFWIMAGALAATSTVDAWSSLSCQRWNPPCIESNPLYGKHPSATRFIATDAAIDGATIIASYFMKRSRNKFVRRLWWVLPSYSSGAHVRYGVHNWTMPHHLPPKIASR